MKFQIEEGKGRDEYVLTDAEYGVAVTVNVIDRGTPSPRNHRNGNDPDNTGEPCSFKITQIHLIAPDEDEDIEAINIESVKDDVQQALDDYFD